MRSNYPIKFTLEIPFPINDYDNNNVFYLDSCLNSKDLSQYENLPLVCVNSCKEDWDSKIIKINKTLELNPSKTALVAKGFLFSGGTAEITNKIKKLKFTEIGINMEN